MKKITDACSAIKELLSGKALTINTYVGDVNPQTIIAIRDALTISFACKYKNDDLMRFYYMWDETSNLEKYLAMILRDGGTITSHKIF